MRHDQRQPYESTEVGAVPLATSQFVERHPHTPSSASSVDVSL
jgi:hypothetical protein